MANTIASAIARSRDTHISDDVSARRHARAPERIAAQLILTELVAIIASLAADFNVTLRPDGGSHVRIVFAT